MNVNPIVLSIPVFFLLIGIEVVIQQIQHRRLYRLNDALTNISCGITQQVSGVFLKLFGIGLYTLVYEYLAVWAIPSNWLSLTILFVAVDFAYYWAHRMSHEINLFWSGHVVHHQSEEYNLSVALRQSSFQVIWTSFFYFPLAIIGFNPIDFALMAALTTLYQFWIHTKVIGKMGLLEYVLVTPSHHRVHHGRDPKYIDKNHGGTFIWWDMMFGTFQKEEETPVYGITKPVNSWNPVWANFAHYQVMWNDLSHIKGFNDKLKYLFNKPGWLPESLGGYQSAPQVDKSQYEKYNTFSPRILNGYVVFQYLLVLAATSWFLFNQSSFSMPSKLLVASVIGASTVTIGALFEDKKWVILVERLRIIILVIGSVIYSMSSDIFQGVIFLATLYLLLSWIWLLVATKNEIKTVQT